MEQAKHNPKEELREKVVNTLWLIRQSIDKYRAVQAGLQDMESDSSDADRYCKAVLQEEVAEFKRDMAETIRHKDFAVRFMFDRELSSTPARGHMVEFRQRYFNAYDIVPADGGTLRLIDTLESTELILPPDVEFRLVLASADAL